MKIFKRWKKVSFTIITIILLLSLLIMILCIPRQGDKTSNIWSAHDTFDISSVSSVRKDPSLDFKLLVMADIQLWSNLSDNNKTFALMDELVNATMPDMIALVGDNVSGITTDILCRQFVKKMESYKIPWAPVFGNHDSEGNATLEWQGDLFEKATYCLFKKGPTNLYGVGNYVVNIVEKDAVIQSLYFFDNGRYYNYGNITKEIYMSYEQIAWYEWNINNINMISNNIVPSMTFSHFAPPEFREAIISHCIQDERGLYIVPKELGNGYCAYLPSVAPVNSGFIDKAKSLNSTKYVFVGHDHENTASINYEGIRYTYALKTGPSPRYWNAAKEYGGTLVTIGSTVKLNNIILWKQ